MNEKIVKAIENEEKRVELARSKEIKKLKKLYRKNLAELRDLNKPAFWDELLSHDKERGYAMYEDKINIVSRMLIGKRGNLLDIGFGNGDLLRKLTRSNSLKLHGLEISNYALSKIKEDIDGEFKNGFITRISFRKDKFDFVIALDVLEHVPPSKIFTALRNVKKVLNNKGMFIISVPLNEGLPGMLKKGENPNGHVRMYTPDLIKAELKIAGFKVVEEKYLYAFRSFYTIKNILRRFFLKERWQPNLVIIKSKNN